VPNNRHAPYFCPRLCHSRRAVRLQDAIKVAQELPRTLCTTIQLEIKYDRFARPAILPQIGLMILAFGSFGLDIDRGSSA